MKVSRGIRNNNPGNLRVSHANNWRGKLTGSAKKDRTFEEFKTLHYGYRALLITLRTYIGKYNLCTLRQIITRWAPPSENDTESYIRMTSEYSGIHTGKCLRRDDKSDLCRIAYAISRVENGQYVGDMELIHRAWEMI